MVQVVVHSRLLMMVVIRTHAAEGCYNVTRQIHIQKFPHFFLHLGHEDLRLHVHVLRVEHVLPQLPAAPRKHTHTDIYVRNCKHTRFCEHFTHTHTHNVLPHTLP